MVLEAPSEPSGSQELQARRAAPGPNGTHPPSHSTCVYLSENSAQYHHNFGHRLQTQFLQEGEVSENSKEKWSRPGPSGFKWKPAGAEKPEQGRELKNAELAKALLSKCKFTEKEWKAFDIHDLRFDDFIKSGASCFQLAAGQRKRGKRSDRQRERLIYKRQAGVTRVNFFSALL